MDPTATTHDEQLRLLQDHIARLIIPVQQAVIRCPACYRPYKAQIRYCPNCNVLTQKSTDTSPRLSPTQPPINDPVQDTPTQEIRVQGIQIEPTTHTQVQATDRFELIQNPTLPNYFIFDQTHIMTLLSLGDVKGKATKDAKIASTPIPHGEPRNSP